MMKTMMKMMKTVMRVRVYVDEEPVFLQVNEKDDLSSVACQLEEKGFNVNPAFPVIYMDGKKVTEWDKVNPKASYKFGK